MSYPHFTGVVLQRRYDFKQVNAEATDGGIEIKWNLPGDPPTPEQITEWALEDLESIANERIEEEQERRAGGGKAVTRNELFLVVRDLCQNAIKPAARNPIDENTPVLFALQNWQQKQRLIKAKAQAIKDGASTNGEKAAALADLIDAIPTDPDWDNYRSR